MPHAVFKSSNFSVVLVHNPESNKFVVVDESRGRGLWLPAGHVDEGEDFDVAAKRECKEEAGIDIDLVGIIRVEHYLTSKTSTRMRVVYYATPTKLDAPLKSIPDEESQGAFWATFEEIAEFKKRGQLRSDEIYSLAKYITEEGPVYPMSLLRPEFDDHVIPSPPVFYPLRGGVTDEL